MAERRSVTALEIKQEVEGYSGMNDEAFARRFYADRAELESLGIELKVEKPAEGYYEAENYTLPPENFYLPAIEFSDAELGALRTALTLLDGEFAYAEPLRLALQQLSWGKPSPLRSPEQPARSSLAQSRRRPADASSRSGCRRSRPRSSAARRSSSTTTRSAGTRREAQGRPVPPVVPERPVLRGGYSHEREDSACSGSRASRARSATRQGRARLPAPADFNPRDYSTRKPPGSSARPRDRAASGSRRDRLARAAPLRPGGHAQPGRGGGRRARVRGHRVRDRVRRRPRSSSSWVLGTATARACCTRPS